MDSSIAEQPRIAFAEIQILMICFAWLDAQSSAESCGQSHLRSHE